MKILHYSTAHVAVASRLFPDMSSDWYGMQWTDDEINACKSFEMADFIAHPSSQTIGEERKHLYNASNPVSEDVDFVHKELSKGARTFLSIGCGLGEKEIALARLHPKVQFTAIDNSPHAEGLNQIAIELGVENIRFMQYDLRNGPLGQFDIVFSFAVIYCIPDDGLEGFFNCLRQSVEVGGRIFVGCSSNLPLIEIVKHPMRWVLRSIHRQRLRGYKVTGWKRTISHIRARIPHDLTVCHTEHQDHFHSRDLLSRLFSSISKNVYPITNAGYLLELRQVN